MGGEEQHEIRDILRIAWAFKNLGHVKDGLEDVVLLPTGRPGRDDLTGSDAIHPDVVLPYMKQQGTGHIINISSTGAIGPGEGPYTNTGTGGIAYGSGKAHLKRLTQGLAQEAWEDGIAVNALSPRKAIASEGQRWFRGDSRNYIGSREDGIIMGDAGVYICSHAPQDYTGRILYDEDVLSDAGVTDLSHYPLVTG